MHQLAQKFSTTTWPLRSERRSVSPASVVSAKSGAARPGSGEGTSFASRVRPNASRAMIGSATSGRARRFHFMMLVPDADGLAVAARGRRLFSAFERPASPRPQREDHADTHHDTTDPDPRDKRTDDRLDRRMLALLVIRH